MERLKLCGLIILVTILLIGAMLFNKSRFLREGLYRLLKVP